MTAIRVVIADDSRTTLALLRAILDGDPAITVVGEAKDGLEAVRLTKALRPALVVMDIEMPRMNGFEATKQIMIEAPTPIVVVSSREDVREVEVGLQAVAAGAVTVTAKPHGSPIDAESRRLVMLVKALADVHVVRHHPRTRSRTVSASRAAGRREPRIAVAAVAASTGGPAVLYRFLEALPVELPIPVLLVQHIARGFEVGLARWLQGATRLPVAMAAEGMPLRAGSVFLAPQDRHLEVVGDDLHLSEEPAVGGFRPSANVLFASAARRFGARSAAIVLTGMGDDGLVGARAVRQAGGLVLAQDQASSTVYGMPGAIAAAGLADQVGTVEELARFVVDSAR